METLNEAQQRADRAEKELAQLRQDEAGNAASDRSELSLETEETKEQDIEDLRKDSMMSHLLDSLNAGEDIGHYGRLVFAMIAGNFIADGEVVRWLAKDRDFSRDQAAAMLQQVKHRDYSPPRRERILEWQREQSFQILPNADDPDCGNVYKTLKFTDDVYEHIQTHQTEKTEAEDSETRR